MKKTVILAATLIVAALLAVALWPKNQPAPAFALSLVFYWFYL